jgi:hypothetical protein
MIEATVDWISAMLISGFLSRGSQVTQRRVGRHVTHWEENIPVI